MGYTMIRNPFGESSEDGGSCFGHSEDVNVPDPQIIAQALFQSS